MTLVEKSASIENKPATNEVIPKKVLGGAIVGLLALLIILVWFGFQNQANEKFSVNEPSTPASTTQSTVSDDEFQDSVGRELKRKRNLRRLKDAKPSSPKDPVQLVQEINDRKQRTQALIEKDPYQQVLQEFQVEELRRALVARNSPITGGYQSSADGATVSGTRPTFNAETGLSTSGTQIRDESTIRNKILRLQQKSNQLNSNVSLAEEKYNQANSDLLDQFSKSDGAINSHDLPNPNQSNGPQNSFSNKAIRASIPKNLAGSNSTYLNAPPFGSVTVGGASVMHVTLQTKVSSDTPGQFLARIERDVYDHSGNFIVIPIGSKVLGNAVAIEAENEAINNRMGMVISEIRRPDNSVIDMKDYDLLDSDGITGLKSKTNYHILAQTLGTIGYAITVGGSALLLDDLLKESDTAEKIADVAFTCRPTTKTTTTTDSEGNIFTTEETSEICVDNKSVSAGGVSVSTGDEDSKSTITTEFLRGMQGLGSSLFGRYIGLTPTKLPQPGDPMTIITTADIYATPWRSVYQTFVE